MVGGKFGWLAIFIATTARPAARSSAFQVTATVTCVSVIDINHAHHKWRWRTNCPENSSPPTALLKSKDGVERPYTFPGPPGVWRDLPDK